MDHSKTSSLHPHLNVFNCIHGNKIEQNNPIGYNYFTYLYFRGNNFLRIQDIIWVKCRFDLAHHLHCNLVFAAGH